jgi:spermidine synthase
MVASGFAGLGYQVVWTQQCALWLGHEAAAVLAVVTAFFGGLALGALSFGARIESSRRPALWYAACELVIGAWGVVLALAMAPLSAWLLALTGAQPTPQWQWCVAFFGTFFLLLPATAAMGATLPAIERATSPLRRGGGSIAALYAANTFGAVLGVLAIAFSLAPTLGLTRTSIVCASLNLACATAAMLIFRTAPGGLSKEHRLLPPSAAPDRRRAANVLLRLAATGLLGIGYEVLVVRVLSQVAEDTVYTFALLLAVYLLGSAGGAALYQRLAASRPVPQPAPPSGELVGERLLVALATACLAGTACLYGAERLQSAALHLFGPGMGAALAAEAVLALVAFGPSTIVMGALFSHLSAQASAAGVSFGRALGTNTLAAAAAPVAFGVLALPSLGAKLALVLVAAGYLLLAGVRSWRSPILWLPAAAALALALWAPSLAFIDVPDGGRVVSYREGVMAAVSVVEDADGIARLRIDNRQQEGSSATLRVDGRQAWLPLLLHAGPRRALFLGLGTGVTAASAAEDPGLQVDAVELLPEVVAASRHFRQDDSADGGTKPAPHVIVADARRYVHASKALYDVVVSDNFHPARSGAGSLYTVEHFAAVRARLASGGIFCQWLPLHQLDLATLRSIVRSFIEVYPEGWAMLASNSLETPVIGLVAHAGDARFDVEALRTRLAHAALPQRLAQLGIEDDFALLGSFVAGPRALQRFAAGADLNTDDRPVVAYRAPRITYAPDSLPRDRLAALLDEVSIEPADLLAPMADRHWPRRLAAYWQARDRFIASGREVRPSADVNAMLAQVREPLLAVLRISPDFRLAYDPLLGMARMLAQSDPGSARALLVELAQLQPARPDATAALLQLAGR